MVILTTTQLAKMHDEWVLQILKKAGKMKPSWFILGNKNNGRVEERILRIIDEVSNLSAVKRITNETTLYNTLKRLEKLRKIERKNGFYVVSEKSTEMFHGMHFTLAHSLEDFKLLGEKYAISEPEYGLQIGTIHSDNYGSQNYKAISLTAGWLIQDTSQTTELYEALLRGIKERSHGKLPARTIEKGSETRIVKFDFQRISGRIEDVRVFKRNLIEGLGLSKLRGIDLRPGNNYKNRVEVLRYARDAAFLFERDEVQSLFEKLRVAAIEEERLFSDLEEDKLKVFEKIGIGKFDEVLWTLKEWFGKEATNNSRAEYLDDLKEQYIPALLIRNFDQLDIARKILDFSPRIYGVGVKSKIFGARISQWEKWVKDLIMEVER